MFVTVAQMMVDRKVTLVFFEEHNAPGGSSGRRLHLALSYLHPISCLIVWSPLSGG